MMKRTVIFLLLGLLAATDVLAQNRIFGIVTDGNGDALGGRHRHRERASGAPVP